MKVFITGATGLLGKAVVAKLHEKGYETRALVHATAIQKNDPLVDTEIVWGDIQRESDHGDYLKGCDMVVHCAWSFVRTGDVDEYSQANIEPAISLMRAAYSQGITKFITISSVSVYGLEPKQNGMPFAEDDDFCSYTEAMDVYPRAKQLCETQMIAVANELRFPLTIIRPGLLYSDEVAPVKKSIKGKVSLLAGMGNNHLPYVHVDSVAELIVDVLEAPVVEGEAIEILNAVPANNDSARAAFLRWKKQTGSTSKTIYLPVPAFKLLALAPYLIKTALKKKAARPNVEYQTKTGTRNVDYSAERAMNKYGWVGF